MLPQLKDFNWYIDMKLIPGANGQRIQQPSCVLSLDVCRDKQAITFFFYLTNEFLLYRSMIQQNPMVKMKNLFKLNYQKKHLILS